MKQELTIQSIGEVKIERGNRSFILEKKREKRKRKGGPFIKTGGGIYK